MTANITFPWTVHSCFGELHLALLLISNSDDEQITEATDADVKQSIEAMEA